METFRNDLENEPAWKEEWFCYQISNKSRDVSVKITIFRPLLSNLAPSYTLYICSQIPYKAQVKENSTE